MAVFLEALALQSYRGIGTEMQKMTGFQDFNFFIGANNAGKSSVLTFLSRHLVPERNPDGSISAPPLGQLEQHAAGMAGPPVMAIGIPRAEFYKNADERLTSRSAEIENSLRTICDKLSEEASSGSRGRCRRGANTNI